MSRLRRPPERGDLVQVDWVDIYEDSTGDPNASTLGTRTSFGLFWGEGESHGVKTLTTTTTADDEGVVGQSGYCCYPLACVRRVSLIKRGRRKK